MRAIVPVEPDQELVSEAIGKVKAGNISPETAALARHAANALALRGAEAVLAACTELPVILSPADSPVLLIDPTDVLAQAAVQSALDPDAPVRLVRGRQRARVDVV
jgi:aspartate racemase